MLPLKLQDTGKYYKAIHVTYRFINLHHIG